VWTGTEWEFLGTKKTPSYSFNLNQTYFELPSGHDARGAVTPQDLIATWAGEMTTTWTMYHSDNSGTFQIDLINPTAKNGTVGASPYSITIEPKAMNNTAGEPTDRWFTRETKIVFTSLDNDCGRQVGQHIVTLNQTNYAIRANYSFSNSMIKYTTISPSSFGVESNAAWKTIIGDPYDVLDIDAYPIPEKGGMDVPYGGVETTPIRYKASDDIETKYYSATITFQDTASVKRFNDLTVTILNCRDIGGPTLAEWALRLGYTTEEINAVKNGTAPNDGGVSSVIKNGYQLHRDQGDDGLGNNGNLFISSVFGGERWMITNVAATSFAADGGRTGDDNTVYRQLPDVPQEGKYSDSDPKWCYPSTVNTNFADTAIYNNNPRIGLLYNWAAATNCRGGSNGQTVFDDGEKAATPDIDPQTTKIQGICPNGWHLPSDWEWTKLEKIINDNTAAYSSTVGDGKEIEVGKTGWRGSHGRAMVDVCPAPRQPYGSNGYSNVISPEYNGGFNIMLTGGFWLLAPTDYGQRATLWSSSGTSASTTARSRTVDGDNKNQAFSREGTYRKALISVRCKKD